MANRISLDDYAGWRSLPHMFFDRADTFRDQPFLWSKEGKKWRPLTWARVEAEASRLSRGLRTLGIGPGDRVVLVAENRPEWLIAELAILSARAIAVPAYTTNTDDDHTHIIENVKAEAAIVTSRKLAGALLKAAHRAPSCRVVIALEKIDIDQELGGVEVRQWEDVAGAGEAEPDDVREFEAQAKRTDTAVIIHTSGTGGAPKGVMLSHGSIISNCMGGFERIHEIEYGKEIFLSFLPLSHAYEHMAGLWMPTSVGAQIYYAQGIDSLVGDMAEVKPTVMTAVPRLYEVMHARVAKAMKGMKGLKRAMFERALELGRKKYETGSLSFGERVTDGIVDRLVRSKVRGRFGGRLKFFVSGGAPLNYDIGLYFTSLGVRLLQGYGQTEAAPLISVNPAEGRRMHTVGPPVAGVELRIAEDGEICVRGELVMQGYYGDPDSTALAIQDGWLHTGDVGELDQNGHIVITDRKKDIIVNSGGDNVSPQRVEGFLTLQPEIAQAMVVGDKRPHLVAIIVPDLEEVSAWARENGKPVTLADLADDPDFHDYVGRAVERVNLELSNIERVRRFMLSPEEFTTDNEMLTPSMKVRRHIVKRKYGAQLDALYGKGEGPPRGKPPAAKEEESGGEAPAGARPATA